MKKYIAHKINKFKIIHCAFLALGLFSGLNASKEVNVKAMHIEKCTKLISIGKTPPLSGYIKGWLEIYFGKNNVQDTGYVLWIKGNEVDSLMIGKFVNITYEPDSISGVIGKYKFKNKFGKVIKYIKEEKECE